MILYYIKAITNEFKILIDTGAGIYIFNQKTADNYKKRFSENAITQGIAHNDDIRKIDVTYYTLRWQFLYNCCEHSIGYSSQFRRK